MNEEQIDAYLKTFTADVLANMREINKHLQEISQNLYRMGSK